MAQNHSQELDPSLCAFETPASFSLNPGASVHSAFVHWLRTWPGALAGGEHHREPRIATWGFHRDLGLAELASGNQGWVQ